MALKFDKSEPGVWLSSAAHVALLVAALLAFADKLPDAEEGIPVEIVTDNEFSQITRGERTAKEVLPTPKPRAERVADKVEERDPGDAKKDTPAPPQRPPEMKVAEQEVEAAAPPPPPMRPSIDKAAPAAARAEPQPTLEPPKRPAMAEPAKTPEPPKREELAKLIEREDAESQAAEAKAKADAKAKAATAAKAKEAEAKAVADAKAKAEAEAKLAAEAKAKAEADAKAKAEAEAKAKAVAQAKAKADAEAKARKQAELAQKFNAGDISKLLASKEPSQSTGSTGREVQRTASLGTATGNAQKLNPSMRDALAGLLQSQIEKCYVAPPGAAGSQAVLPVLNIQFGPDGTLSPEPRIVRSGPSALDRSVAEAALRAVRRCAPYKIPAQYAPFYNDWKNTIAQFELPQV